MDYVKQYQEEADAKIKELREIQKTIKPCPFCGKPVELLHLGYGSGNYGSGTNFVIYCSNCKLDMEGPDTSWTHFYDHNDEVRKFVEKWNTRCEGEHDDE